MILDEIRGIFLPLNWGEKMERAGQESKLQNLCELVERLKSCNTDGDWLEVLNNEPGVLQWLDQFGFSPSFLSGLTPAHEVILKSLIAIGQADHLFASEKISDVFLHRLKGMLEELFPVQDFYKEMGGVVGYHYTMLTFLFLQQRKDLNATYHRPPGTDLSLTNQRIKELILEGIVSLPLLAEMYPVGGAADRLKFCDLETGFPLPAAKLPFDGHTLLERLIRDTQAREYLYFKLFGEQVVTPIAMMTSYEKDNHRLICELCEQKAWFGRPKDFFHIFCQPAVPTMDESGKWCLSGIMKLLMKPGGHGVLWKLAEKAGVFEWMGSLQRQKILVRQINNPIAGVDHGLLSFCGVGFQEDKAFGFASCCRQVGSAEGMNILIEKKGSDVSTYRLTNIEYCDFAACGIADVPMQQGSCYSQFPSNTNILFADIAAVQKAVFRCPIPGMLVNLKAMSFVTEEGGVEERKVARLESTMQNLADCFEVQARPELPPSEVPLETYLTYNDRQKTISTIKKLFHEGQSLLETPEGCFYDFFCNAHDLLTHHCNVQVPSKDVYNLSSPPFLFSYHPALGPLYSIIGQKIQGGCFSLHSELKLEIAELYLENLNLSGSLHITAVRIMGEISEEGILTYSDRSGSVSLRNVVVDNRGWDQSAEHCFWKEEIKREELCEIIVHGDGEFIAENVTLRGAMKIEVAAGTRLTAFEEKGSLQWKKEAVSGPIKKWIYHLSDEGSILLEKPI